MCITMNFFDEYQDMEREMDWWDSNAEGFVIVTIREASLKTEFVSNSAGGEYPILHQVVVHK